VSGDFWQQADSLIDMMLDRSAEPELVAQASRLAEYFEDTAERLERLALAGRG
jgi:flagellar hook-associated protein FlgK